MKNLVKILLVILLALLPVFALGEAAETAETAEVPAFADFSEKFAEKFLLEGSEPIWTENSYQSDDVNITISTRRVERSDVYVVDIYVRSVECFQRVHAGGSYGKTTAKVRKLAAESDAIVAMTGDSGHYFSKGWAVSNGHINRDTENRKRDLGIVYRDGTMVTVPNAELDYAQIRADADAGKIWHIFLFGPALLDAEGKASFDFSENEVRYPNPRSAIGYFEPGHYCFVQVDGRGTKSALEAKKTSVGLEMDQLAKLMEDIGCKAAYNLDGGQSSMLVFNGEIHSTPYHGGRNVGDVVIIKDLPNEAAPAEVEATK